VKRKPLMMGEKERVVGEEEVFNLTVVG